MEIEFALDEADLVALARHHMEHSPASAGATAFAGSGFRWPWTHGVLLYAFFSLRAPALYLGAFAAFFLSSTPITTAGLWADHGQDRERTLEPESLCPSNPPATPDGLELFGAGSKMVKGWDRISGVEVTPDRAFVALDGNT